MMPIHLPAVVLPSLTRYSHDLGPTLLKVEQEITTFARVRARGFPGSTLFGRTHTLRRVCRAITR